MQLSALNTLSNSALLLCTSTIGQERFAAMAPLYYRNAAAVIVCCDVTDEDSFTRMKDWVQEVTSNVPSGIVIAIACNKVSAQLHVLLLLENNTTRCSAQATEAIAATMCFNDRSILSSSEWSPEHALKSLPVQ
jgi:GTPase SAR1 family protein